jgi:hypothetical protein
MRNWINKEPENIIYLISFILVFGLGAVCFLSLAAMF